MSPIPKKGFYDPEPLDSVSHHEERAASIKAEDEMVRQEQADQDEKQKADREQRLAEQRAREDAELGHYAGLVQGKDARERLLERIRQMREEAKPKEIEYPPRNKWQQEQFEAEQAAGRAAVAAHKAIEDEHRERWMKEAEDEKADKRTATTTPVYRPNEIEPKAKPSPKR